MLREEDKDQSSVGSWKSYSRSMSWTERPPRKSNSKPQWNSKARSCLPPLQPLSIIRPSIEEWPRAGSDDLGIWPNPPTPGSKPKSLTPRGNSTLDQPPREFEFRKDMLAFFDKECSKILDHVYLGSNAIAKSREVLRQNGITHVLNCVGSVCSEYFKNELVYKTLWLQDSPSEDITSILYDVFDYFEDVLEQSGRVFVHCCQGVSRSTSLVIAYLMWKEGKSFDDAFEHVKAARGVTNPNVGFACQLLQCQKRVHALPASPTSVLRMYRMAPHSPYDPLHLVPKLLSEPGRDKLDSRGAFIINIPSALYVWIGKHCSQVMSDNAMAAASQVIRYERVQGLVILVKEGEESFEFWDALSNKNCLADSCPVKSKEENSSDSSHGERKLDEYDIDFEIFHRALAGGVVPPFPLSEAGAETCVPARENGWNRLRRKFAKNVVQDLITSCKELENSDSAADLSGPSSSPCDSPDSFASYVTSSPCWTENNSKEVGSTGSLSDNAPSFDLVDSFSSFLVSKPECSSTSPSISPSTSDYSSSFTVSPSSSNWSDLSLASAQPSPCGIESRDTDPSKSGPLEESSSSVGDSTNLVDDATHEEALSAHRPSRTILPPIDEGSQASENLARYLEDDAARDVKYKISSEIEVKEQTSDANGCMAYVEVLSKLHDEMKYDTFHERRRNVSSTGSHNQRIKNDFKCEEIHTHSETAGCKILNEGGFSNDAQIKVVKESEEPL